MRLQEIQHQTAKVFSPTDIHHRRSLFPTVLLSINLKKGGFMNLTVKKNGGLPSLLSDFFAQSPLLSRDWFGFDDASFPSRLGINVPTANITETAKEFQLELAAPGLQQKDFNVEVDNHTLKISSEKEEEKKEGEGEYSRREYSFNSFVRTFTLPDNVNEKNIDAKYANGILKVTIPKQKETPVKPAHKVTVS
jgi:HSP20 family protein